MLELPPSLPRSPSFRERAITLIKGPRPDSYQKKAKYVTKDIKGGSHDPKTNYRLQYC